MWFLLLACARAPDTGASVPDEVCDNGADDDGDGLLDCEDGDCWEDCEAQVTLESGELVSTSFFSGWSSYARSCSGQVSYDYVGVVHELRDVRGELDVHGRVCEWSVPSAVFSGSFSWQDDHTVATLVERRVEPGCAVEPWLPTRLFGQKGQFDTSYNGLRWHLWYLHTAQAETWSSTDVRCEPRSTSHSTLSVDQTRGVQGALLPMQVVATPL
jgi:hypothetical protein